MSRNWDDLENDELYAIWNAYLKSEDNFNNSYHLENPKPMRLTHRDIVQMINLLFERLECEEEDE